MNRQRLQHMVCLGIITMLSSLRAAKEKSHE